MPRLRVLRILLGSLLVVIIVGSLVGMVGAHFLVVWSVHDGPTPARESWPSNLDVTIYLAYSMTMVIGGLLPLAILSVQVMWGHTTRLRTAVIGPIVSVLPGALVLYLLIWSPANALLLSASSSILAVVGFWVVLGTLRRHTPTSRREV